MDMDLRIPKSDEVFSYYEPHVELSPYIAYYSVTKPCVALSSISPQFIPDLGGSLIVSRYENDLELIIWGPFNRLTGIADSPNKAVAQYFIEFQPGGLSRLIYPNSNELLNQKIPLAEIDFEVHSALKSAFEQSLPEPSTTVTLLDEYFLGLLKNKKDILESGRHILSVLQGFRQGWAINDLSKETHYSARHINRYLNALAGVSGKNYMRVKRFNKATRILKESTGTIEEAASMLDYYDTAHFVHDFTDIAGFSPSDYRKNVSDFYNESSKKL
jgi:AraC-like DNA-binding protein